MPNKPCVCEGLPHKCLMCDQEDRLRSRFNPRLKKSCIDDLVGVVIRTWADYNIELGITNHSRIPPDSLIDVFCNFKGVYMPPECFNDTERAE